MVTACLVLAIAASLANPGPPARIDAAAFLKGSWTGSAFGGTIVESYNAADGGCVMGTSRIVADGKAIHKEFMLIEERAGTLVYEVVLPNKRHTFQLKEAAANSLTWVDPQNEWPTTIRYTLKDGVMQVVLDGKSKTGKQQTERIEMKPVRG